MKLVGKKVFLTPITYGDCEDFVRWRNSEFVKSKYIYRGNFTVENQINWIKSHVETGAAIMFVIWDKEENKKIGVVYIQNIDHDNKKGEYGIFIGEESFLGRGRGQEAAELICKYAFDEIGISKIYLRVLADNVRAYKSYEKAGFLKEGLFRQDVWIENKPVDVIFMAILKEEI